jgi:hypothetical protein
VCGMVGSQSPQPWIFQRLALGEVADPDVFEAHVAFAAGVELEGDGAVEGFGVGVGEVDHDDAVEAGDVAVAFYFEGVFVPVAFADVELIFGGGPDDPAAAVAVDAAGVLADAAIDFELEAARDVGGAGFEVDVEEDAGVAAADALELEGHVEVFVVLGGLEVAVGFGGGFAFDFAVFDGPLFFADFDPAGEILAVEEVDPVFTGQFGGLDVLGGKGSCQEEEEGELDAHLLDCM